MPDFGLARFLPEPPPLLSGDGVRLTSDFSVSEAAWSIAVADPEFLAWSYFPEGVDEARLGEALLVRQEKSACGLAAYFTALDHAGGILGSVDIDVLNTRDQRADVAYWTRPHARGKGIASTALRVASAWALSTQLERLVAPIHREHAASKRVVEKAGFRYVGPGTNFSFVQGTRAADFYELRREV